MVESLGFIYMGWLKDFHKRAVDIGDVQEVNHQEYESEFGSKVGISR